MAPARTIVAIGLTLALAACTTATTTSSPSALAPSPPTATASFARATPSPIGDVTSLVTPLVKSWKPAGRTLVVEVSESTTATFLALPLTGGDPTPLARVTALFVSGPLFVGFDVRADGGAIVASLPTSASTARLAILDLGRGDARWLTPDLGLREVSPAWSADGSAVYFGRSDLSGDKGLFRVAADDGGLATVRAAGTDGTVSGVTSVTKDNVLLGTEQLNGSKPFVLDLGSGRERSFETWNSTLWSWRSARPRGLVGALTNIAAPGAGYLALWDDVDGTVKRILSTPVGGADFDPAGKGVVAAARLAPDAPSRLVVMGVDGANAMQIDGTDGARDPIWLDLGIVYVVYFGSTAPAPSEARVVAPTGGASRTLYTTSGQITRGRVVGP